MSGIFNGLSEIQSCAVQLSEWVAGRSIHNPVRDECCPDFSCCGGVLTEPKTSREIFAINFRDGNNELNESFLKKSLEDLKS